MNVRLDHVTLEAVQAELGLRDLVILDLQAQLRKILATPGVQEALAAAAPPAAANGGVIAEQVEAP